MTRGVLLLKYIWPCGKMPGNNWPQIVIQNCYIFLANHISIHWSDSTDSMIHVCNTSQEHDNLVCNFDDGTSHYILVLVSRLTFAIHKLFGHFQFRSLFRRLKWPFPLILYSPLLFCPTKPLYFFSVYRFDYDCLLNWVSILSLDI